MELAGHLPELIIVLVVILIIWGPGKLPDLGQALGRGLHEFRKASTETRDSVQRAMATPDEPAAPAPLPGASAATPAAAAVDHEPDAPSEGASAP
jgi:TatA/E family protein of Tat protein translocase